MYWIQESNLNRNKWYPPEVLRWSAFKSCKSIGRDTVHFRRWLKIYVIKIGVCTSSVICHCVYKTNHFFIKFRWITYDIVNIILNIIFVNLNIFIWCNNLCSDFIKHFLCSNFTGEYIICISFHFLLFWIADKNFLYIAVRECETALPWVFKKMLTFQSVSAFLKCRKVSTYCKKGILKKQANNVMISDIL